MAIVKGHYRKVDGKKVRIRKHRRSVDRKRSSGSNRGWKKIDSYTWKNTKKPLEIKLDMNRTISRYDWAVWLWDYRIEPADGTILAQRLKTKYKAEEFAKTWMRKHSEG